MAMSRGSNLSIWYAHALILLELGFRISLVTMILWFKFQAILRFCYLLLFLLKVMVLSWGSDCATDVLYTTSIRFLKLCRCCERRILCIWYIRAFVLLELGFLISPETMRILFFKICAILSLLVKVTAVLWWSNCILISTYILRFWCVRFRICPVVRWTLCFNFQAILQICVFLWRSWRKGRVVHWFSVYIIWLSWG